MKNLIAMIAFFLFAMQLNAKHINVLEQDTRKVNFKIETDKNLTSYIAVISEAGKNIKPTKKLDFKGLNLINDKNVFYVNDDKTNMFMIEGLIPATKYDITLYKNDEKFTEVEKTNFCTETMNPAKNPTNIAYKYLGDNKYNFKFNGNKGDGYIVVASTQPIKNKPKNMKTYNPAPYGAKIMSYEGGENVIFSTRDKKDKNSCDITIKSTEKFYIAVFSFSGSEDCVYYDAELSKGNAREITPGLDAPVAIDARSFPNGFLARWKAVDKAEKYYLDVAYDENFSKYVENYEAVDYGNATEVPVIINDSSISEVYYRIRAIGDKRISPYSNVITVRLK